MKLRLPSTKKIDCLRSLSFQVAYIDLYSRFNILLTLLHPLFSYFFLRFLSSFFSSIFLKDISSIIYLFLIFLAMHCQTCGILLPWSRIQPRPSAVKLRSPNHWTTRKFPSIIFMIQFTHLFTNHYGSGSVKGSQVKCLTKHKSKLCAEQWVESLKSKVQEGEKGVII